MLFGKTGSVCQSLVFRSGLPTSCTAYCSGWRQCCYRLAYPTILSICELLGWHRTTPYLPSSRLGLGLLTYCFVAVNPVFEEMLVRAFLMSETILLTGSSTLAILFSTLLQTSYHVYQGAPYALAAGVIFLIFSVYYACTRRILPVILAHFIWDLWAHVYYALPHAGASH
jgi:membrane protease YdiL (CAAX protease family)